MTRASTLAAFTALCLSGAFAPVFAASVQATVHHAYPRPHAVKPGFAGGVLVPMDQVRIVTFSKPISQVYVGNPVIADATLIDSRRVYVMGKTYGATNMVALGLDGTVVVDEQVDVTGRSAGLVTLNRGSETFNFACATHCETQPVPGDPRIWFKETHDSREQQEDYANKQAAVGAGDAGHGGGQ